MTCIVGAGGFIGKHFAKAFPEALALTHKDLDLLDPIATREYFTSRHFELIIFCACVGGRRTSADDQRVFADNVSMFENVYTCARYSRFVWFSSGADGTPYGNAKRYIEQRVATNPRVNTYKLWGCFGPGEACHRFFTTGLNGKLMIERDRYFDFVHVNDLIHIVKTVQEPLVNVVYPEKYKLSELAEMAGFDYMIKEPGLDPPYIGHQNVPLVLPPLKERIHYLHNESGYNRNW